MEFVWDTVLFREKVVTPYPEFGCLTVVWFFIACEDQINCNNHLVIVQFLLNFESADAHIGTCRVKDTRCVTHRSSQKSEQKLSQTVRIIHPVDIAHREKICYVGDPFI